MTMSIEREELIEKIFVDKMFIGDLGLSGRSFNCLVRAGIRDVETLLGYETFELSNIRNFGSKSREEVEDVIDAFKIPALHLGMTDDEINSLLSEEQKIKREERIRKVERIREVERIKEEAKKIREEEMEQMKILELKNKMLTEKNKEMQEINRRKQEKLEKLRILLEEKGRLEEESRRLDEEINEFLNCLEKENEVVNNEKGKN